MSLSPPTTSQNNDTSVSVESQSLNSKESHESTEQNDDSKIRKIGRWYILETLGKGGYSWVKKGKDEKNGKLVALKFIDCHKAKTNEWSETRAVQVATEILILKDIKHENVVKLYAYNTKAQYPNQDGTTREVMLLVLDYMSGGELFDILYYTSALGDILARTYFHQLISGMEALHQLNVIHRDIKPQNLLLDKNYTLKITDFGLSKILENSDDSMMTYKVGTKGYQAPEILEHKPYTSSCDIFACGIVLFVLLTGYPPFQEARNNDRWYGHIYKQEFKKFWKFHKDCGIDAKAMDLMTRMMHPIPNDRITLPNIKKHPWFIGKTVDQEELVRILQIRHSQMELKRSSDPIKQSILQASEKYTRPLSQNKNILNDSYDSNKNKYLKPTVNNVSNDSLENSMPPTLDEEEAIGINDVFTTASAKEVLTYIANFAEEKFGLFASIDFNTSSMSFITAIQGNVVNGTCEVFVQMYYVKQHDCNLVKFRRIEGEDLVWHKTYELLMRWLSPVLTGVPKKTEKEEISENASEKYEDILKQYFNIRQTEDNNNNDSNENTNDEEKNMNDNEQDNENKEKNDQ